MTQLDYFIVLVAGLTGVLFSERIAWGIVALLAVAKLLKVE